MLDPRSTTDDNFDDSLSVIINYNSKSLNLSDIPMCPDSTTHVSESDQAHLKINNTTAAHFNGAVFLDPGIIEEIATYTEIKPVTISNCSQEIIVRTSHDPAKNIIIEELDILPDSEQPLDTSTPLGSPFLSTL